MRRVLAVFATLLVLPVLVSATDYVVRPAQPHWSRADGSPVGLAPDPLREPAAVVQVYSARAYRWRGIFGVHSWIALKAESAARYTRYEVTGWGQPVRINGGAADGRWIGNDPKLLFEARGAEAAAMIPKIQAAIAGYRYARRGDYVVWPGPNSNTFVAEVARAVPELRLVLPPNAVGKDFAPDWLTLLPTPSNTGWQVSFAGYGGFAAGLAEGIEVHVLGQTLGVDLLRPALKLSVLGRFGMAPAGGRRDG